MYIYHLHTWYVGKSKEVNKPPEIGVRGGCEPQSEFWKSNPDPFQDQQLFLTTEPSLHIQNPFSKGKQY